MVDEAFKLSVDIAFPPPEVWPNSKKHHIPSPSKGFEMIFNENDTRI